MDEPKESRRTRSKAAPEWTVEESLILVNEISAVESEWGVTLPSFQKWQQIVENCNTLDVSRNLNQCKRRWDALLSAYRLFKPGGAPEDGSFPVELFRAVDRCVNASGKRNAGGGMGAEAEEAAEAAAEEVDHEAMESDPDSDPEAQGCVTKFFFETGTKKQRRRMKRKKRRLETWNPWGYFTSPKIKREESTSNGIRKEMNMPEENDAETNEQIMAKILWENALQINSILDDDVDYKLADLKNADAVRTDCVTRKGDKLIVCLGQISSTLDRLCDFVQKCN